MKRLLLLPCLMVMAMMAWAQGWNNTGEYYQAANGKKGAELKTALHNILRYDDHPFVVVDDEDGSTHIENKHFIMVPYSGLFDAYEDTDLRSNGKIWDMYSNTTDYNPSNHTGSYDGEGPVDSKNYDGDTTTRCMYNREHSVPQSWFNGEQGKAPYSDLFHVYPTDGYVNNKRSNFPFGEVKNFTWQSHNGFSKLGPCAIEGYSGTVFEPNDEYKGDFARTYFYMATCYQNVDFTQDSQKYGEKVFESGSKQTYPTLKTWALNMFIEWSHTDEVSDKEYNRNEAVYQLQFNRNPFIDYPGLEQYIWGGMMEEEFSYDNYKVPENYSLYIPGDDPGPDDPPIIIPSEGEFVYQRVTATTTNGLEEGAGYIIVCESKNTALADQNSGNYRNYVSLTTTDGAVATQINKNGKPYELTLGVTSDGKYYTLYDATAKVYLAHTKAENKLHTATLASATGAQWTIEFSGDNAVITNPKTNYSIKYNSQANATRFSCYSSGQTDIQLYKRQPVSSSVSTATSFPIEKAKPNTIIYDLQGRKVGTTVNGMPRLKKGIYILGGRKVIAK